jgi:sodium/potassium-transporting ATPase subunit alpha
MTDVKKGEERSAALRKDINYGEVDFNWSQDRLCQHFNVDISKGLTSAQYQANLAKYGPNCLTPPAKMPAWLKFLLQFTNFFALLLLVGGALCFIGYGIDTEKDPTNLYLGVVLFSVVIITATFSHFQEAKSEQIMEGFAKLIPKQTNVWRDGNVKVVDAAELVPGDVVDLNDGDQVPADVMLVRANECKVDNSSLTGESEAQDRGSEPGNVNTAFEAPNLAFFTTIVVTGTCKGVVVGTADNTAMGQIAGLTTETTNDESPIASEIKKFIHLISAVAIVLGITFFVIGLVLGTDIIKNVVFMIGIIVANVPEGLLATVTVSLALTAQRMHKKNVLVKNLEAVETLGSTTIIASDKTGTLTQNRMTVQHCWYDLGIHRVPAAKNTTHLKELLNSAAPGGETYLDRDCATWKKLQMVAALCNNSQFLTEGAGEVATLMADPTFNLLGMDATGDASEQGITKSVQLYRDVQEYRAANPKLQEIKFNSTNKWQLSVHKQEQAGAPTVVVLKGAPERVLLKCKYMCIEGQVVPITPELETQYTTAYEELGGLGERVLGFAYAELDSKYDDKFKYEIKPAPNFPVDDLVFAGLLSLIDPPREGVPEAVEKCKRARIKVFMVTGDHPITAQAIAKQVGIIDQDMWDAGRATVVKGDDIRDWEAIEDPVKRQAMWDAALSHQQIVFARVSPAHKLQIVENNQRRGEVVAVTGDGVNDAPALKKGDIGVAMGIAGKDVSKEAADMILMDDNFASIVNGVEEGRLIFDNLKKSICYTLTSNIPEIGPFLIFITLRLPLPLSTVLILCVDLGTDMVPAISMAYEEKESDIMDRAPRNSATDRLVNSRLIAFAYLQIGVMQALAGFFTYMVVLNDYGYAPWTLPMIGLEFEKVTLMCTIDGRGMPLDCGYGCNTPEKYKSDALGIEEYEYCKGGCKIPFSTGTEMPMVDPFLEFRVNNDTGASMGFYSTGPFPSPCQRTCQNYWALEADKKAELNTAEVAGFDHYCGTEAAPSANAVKYMADRGDAWESGDRSKAPDGAFYWWAGRQQFFPNRDYQAHALAYAQTSYFISIIVVQWADLLIAKTRKLSLFEQGMSNGFMNFGLMFETVLGCFLIYVPVMNMVFGTRPLHILHWFPGIPWSILILLYDEMRKYQMRQYPRGWLERFTYW